MVVPVFFPNACWPYISHWVSLWWSAHSALVHFPVDCCMPVLVYSYCFFVWYTNRLELRDHWRLENRRAFANIWSDMVYGISLFILLYFNQSKVSYCFFEVSVFNELLALNVIDVRYMSKLEGTPMLHHPIEHTTVPIPDGGRYSDTVTITVIIHPCICN